MPVRSLRLGLLALLALNASAFAAPAHYVVFTLDANDRAEPVFYAPVDLADVRTRADTAQIPPASSPRQTVAWQAMRGGAKGPLGQVVVPRMLHVESADDAGELARIDVAAPERAFAVRVPFDEGDAIELVTDARVQRFDLAGIAARAATLPLAATTFARTHTAQRGKALNSANRVDILVLGDGYTSAQESTFDTHAETLRTGFFNVTPYKEYASFVNWQPGFVASAQSGADHPPYQANCSSSSCCADTAAQTDPRANTFVDTALDAHFCTSQVHRALYISPSKALAAAAGYPDWDQILVTVNDPVYGGAGGSIAVQSVHAQAKLIVIHEYGHTFSGLADEYSTPYPGFPDCTDLGGGSPCEPNVTNQTNAAQVKWSGWFTPGIAIPTPTGTAGLGLFEGARYKASGMYRPTNSQCAMRALGTTFCNVCRQEYILSMYRGGFGEPSSGIDLIEHGSEHPSTAAPVAVATGTPRTFSATLLRPTGGVTVEWRLDGIPVGGANTENYTFQQAGATPATRTLELRVTDPTPMVLPAAAGNLLTHSRAWTIHVGNDRLFADGFQ